MTKQEFIQELTTALAPIDAQVRAEIIADINEHFAEGVAHGQTEEEICKNLGQPGQIAEQVLEEYKAYKAQNSDDYSSSIDDIVSSAMEVIDDLDIGSIVSSALHSAADARRMAADIRRDARQAAADVRRDVRQAAADARRAAADVRRDARQAAADARRDAAYEMECTSNGPRTIGLHIGGNNAPWSGGTVTDADGATRIQGGYNVDIDKSFSGVSGIDIGLSVADIKLVPAGQSNEVRVTIQGQSRYNAFGLENKNGILYVRLKEPFFKFEIFGFKSSLIAEVHIPASFSGDIRAKTSFGNISTQDINGNLELSTSAGNIKIDGHNGYKAHLRSNAGNVSLKGSFIDFINAKSSAGNVTVESRETAGLTLSSSAGNIDVHVEKLGGDANLSTSAGEVHLMARNVQGNITARSSAGSIHMHLPKDVNCRIDVKKPSMGSLTNYLTGNPHSPYTLRASTSVGSIVLEALASHQN